MSGCCQESPGVFRSLWVYSGHCESIQVIVCLVNSGWVYSGHCGCIEVRMGVLRSLWLYLGNCDCISGSLWMYSRSGACIQVIVTVFGSGWVYSSQCFQVISVFRSGWEYSGHWGCIQLSRCYKVIVSIHVRVCIQWVYWGQGGCSHIIVGVVMPLWVYWGQGECISVANMHAGLNTQYLPLRQEYTFKV